MTVHRMFQRLPGFPRATLPTGMSESTCTGTVSLSVMDSRRTCPALLSLWTIYLPTDRIVICPYLLERVTIHVALCRTLLGMHPEPRKSNRPSASGLSQLSDALIHHLTAGICK